MPNQQISQVDVPVYLGFSVFMIGLRVLFYFHLFYLTTMTKSVKFNGNNIIVELKDTFKVLQDIKRTYKNEDRNCNLRTQQNPTISTKNDVLETSFVNGAG